MPARPGSGSASSCHLMRGPARSPRRSMAGPPRGCRTAIPPQAVSARASRAGSSTSRAIARACGLAPCCRWHQSSASSMALSASARARTAGATSAGCAFRSVRAASNQASPSRMRPRANHSGCSDDASANASSISEFSRLHANAARRLSISVSACSMTLAHGRLPRRGVEQGGHGRVVVAVTRAHGVGLAGLAELFLRVLAHRLQQPVSRSARCVFGHDQGLVDQQGELIEDLVALARRRRRRPPGRRRGRTHP